MRRFQKNLNGGIVSLVLLAVLERTDEDLYGYEITRRLAAANAGRPIFSDGAIYPVLRTLARDGLLSSRIVPSYDGPPRRYYRITDAGRELLRQWLGVWRETRDFVEGFINAGPA